GLAAGIGVEAVGAPVGRMKPRRVLAEKRRLSVQGPAIRVDRRDDRAGPVRPERFAGLAIERGRGSYGEICGLRGAAAYERSNPPTQGLLYGAAATCSVINQIHKTRSNVSSLRPVRDEIPSHWIMIRTADASFDARPDPVESCTRKTEVATMLRLFASSS